MPSWSNHKAYIYEYGTDGYIGALVGTITNILAHGAGGTNPLDESGDGWLVIHGADTPSVSLCQEFRVARVTAESSVSGNEHEVCCFIIQSITPKIVGRHVIYTLSGADLTGSIKWGTPLYNVISDLAGGPSSTPIDDVLVYTNKYWTVTEHGTAPNGAVWVGAGEKSYEAMLGLLQQQNAHFSFALKSNPSFDIHVWYGFTETAPTGFDALTILETETPEIYQADPNTAVLSKPVIIHKEKQEVFTRGYFYGAGMGPDAWTMEQANFGAILVPGWGINTSQSLLVNTTLETTIPQITTVKRFPYLEPLDPTDETAVQTNARAIYYAAKAWLTQRAQSVIEYYEVPKIIIHADIVPGQLVHLACSRNSVIDAAGDPNATSIIDIDDDLILLRIEHEIGADGNRYSSLLLGATPKPLGGGLDMMANKLKELDDTVKHTSAGSGTPGAPSGGGDSSTYLWAAGSGPVLAGDLDVADLVTIDGVDVSAHAASPTAHHSPGTLTADTINANNGTESHAIENSSNPGAQRIILSTDAGGKIVLVRGDFDSLVLTDRNDSQKYNIFLDDGRMYIEPIT